ncbi:hypothetical protein [Roseospirillum parvum]|uniref:Uncharacterized protein n=1 Tax=Roseospirillum parvum TaxID=83401 RepID=A0A1G7YCU4_9PROT|nr:hypothetical protein [Roseospirillum parvum]SDG93750.1 hypothetical protein SAMN05421742_103251 [Roseospirillum parvum]
MSAAPPGEPIRADLPACQVDLLVDLASHLVGRFGGGASTVVLAFWLATPSGLPEAHHLYCQEVLRAVGAIAQTGSESG